MPTNPKKLLFTVAVFLILVSAGFSAFADDQTVFGPRDFKIGRWRMHLSLHRFKMEQSGEGTIIIRKNTPERKVRNGFMLLNGQCIFLGDFLRSDRLVLEEDVKLRARNFVLICLRGARGASIRIEVRKRSVPSINHKPVAHDQSVITAEDAPISITLTGSDPDGDFLAYDMVSDPSHGTLHGTVPELNYTPDANYHGPDFFEFKVNDGEYESEVATVMITVTPVNDPPVADAGPDRTEYVGDVVILDGSASYDVESDAENLTYQWTVTLPPGSAAALVSSDSVNPYFVPDVSGDYTVHLVVNDGQSPSAPDTADIKAEPRPVQVEPQPEGSFGKQYEDLTPSNVTIESYDPRRFSLVTGVVQDLDALPLTGVLIRILGKPGYGSVHTNAEGRFTIPVEGGSTLTLVYHKEGLISAQRKVRVPWNEIAVAETTQMIPEDPLVGTITFDGKPDTVMLHRSTEVRDERGARACTMVFTGDNRAYALDTQGSVIGEMSEIKVRATEFPTPESMPAILPPTSAFTYCAELSVDSVQRVKFDKPIVVWIDNFLGFEVGEIVPVGYYDRDKGAWVPSDNGLVVRLMDDNGDGMVDAYDTDDQVPIDGSVVGLEDSSRYPPGSTFWRVELGHFTPIDCNWPIGLPPGSIRPNPVGSAVACQKLTEQKDCKRRGASFVEDRSGVLHQNIPITGTGMTLHYASNRAKGYKILITVPASGATVPTNLKQIVVHVDVAGRTFEEVLPPEPFQKAEFLWDRLDCLGRDTRDFAKAKVNVGFVYQAVYLSGDPRFRAFGQAGTSGTGVSARQEITVWLRSELNIDPVRSAKSCIAEGWTLSAHHALNPVQPSTLNKGDGTILRSDNSIIETVGGNGQEGYSGDGGPAKEARISYPQNLTFDGQGNLYFAEYYDHRVRKVDLNGIITTVAGTGVPGWSGDRGPATQAELNYPWDVAVDSKGNLYISDFENCCIRKVDAHGIITTIANAGACGYSGDGGPAISAAIRDPKGIAVDDEGNIFFADGDRIRKIDTNGTITTIAGTGDEGYSGDGGPALQATFSWPYDVEVDQDGNVFISDTFNCRVRKIDRSGIITTVAGSGNWDYGGDGGPATQAGMSETYGIALDGAGNLYIAEYNNRIRKVHTDGVITTIAGNGTEGSSGDGGPATAASLEWPLGVGVHPSGNLYIADTWYCVIRRVAPPSSFAHVLGLSEIPFAEESGIAHLMTSAGGHKSTLDLATGLKIYDFAYDDTNSLTAITDGFGNVTRIQRDGNNFPIAIVSSDGLTTALMIDSDNHLLRITQPDQSSLRFEYRPDGLITAKIEPEGNRFEYEYDIAGRLTDVFDEEQGHWHFHRRTTTEGDILTTVTTGEGDTTSYLDHTSSTGAYESIISGSDGAETLYSQSADGLTARKFLPCGMELDFKCDVDPEYKFRYVKEMRETTPSGLERATERDRIYEDTDSDDIPDLITEKVTVNGKSTTIENDVLLARRRITSPEGRTVTAEYDPDNLTVTKLISPGFYETEYDYDAAGRLVSVFAAARETSLSYDSDGFLSSVTDPELQTIDYQSDALGRITRALRPDSSSIWFDYDRNDNMTVLTNPAQIAHAFNYNNVNLGSSYQMPLSGSYEYTYDKDRRLTEIKFPSVKLLSNVYKNGRLEQIQTPEGEVGFTYACGSKIGTISKGSESIVYDYDGTLLVSESLSGTMNQVLSYAYNNDFRVERFSYGGKTTSYAYDQDGLLVGSGIYAITRNVENGLPEQVSGEALILNRGFSGYGEVRAQTAFVSGREILHWSVERDGNGRIVEKTERVGSKTSTYSYTYDPLGRLRTVSKDGLLVEEYQYDPDGTGTRSYEQNVSRGITGRAYVYSEEDHLLTAGGAIYEHNLDGFLSTKTNDDGVTRYSYSTRGELLRVELPDGRVLQYIHDPLGRRIAKLVNGVVIEKYLWQGLTRLLAVFDGEESLIMRFEYADDRVPAAMTMGESKYSLTYDQVGSLRLVADQGGNIIKEIDYDSFGNVLLDSNPDLWIPLGFAGGLHDRDTGLVRFGFRDYDPDVGRWTAKDPILFAGGDTDLYGYCLNDPVSFVDPVGRYTWPYTWKGWAGLILTGTGATFAFVPGGLPVAIGLMAAGGSFTIWDIMEGFRQSEELAESVAKDVIRARIAQAGGNAKWLQEIGMIPPTKRLRELGFADSELREWDLFKENSPCN